MEINWPDIETEFLDKNFELDSFVVDDVFEYIESEYDSCHGDLERIKNKYLEENNSFEVEESEFDDIIEFIEKSLK